MEQEADLKKKINDNIKQAMKSGDTVKRSTLRMLISSINNTEKTKLCNSESSTCKINFRVRSYSVYSRNWP